MNIKLKTGEDLTITTKGGYTITVPDTGGTFATTNYVDGVVGNIETLLAAI